MPERNEERRTRQAAIEQAARARLQGVEMPKRLDFTSKKLHHEYLCFKTLAKKVLECYEGLEDSVKVNKVLMWMGPEACVKHEQHPFVTGDKEKLEPQRNFFDNLCAKKEGCHGSWNAARMTLKFMKQEKGESVDIFYGRIRDVLHQCEYDPNMQKVLEVETLKYGLTNSKITEKVYTLPKDADANGVLDTARAEEQAQMHIREVENQEGTTAWEKLKVQRSLVKRRSPSAQRPRLPVMGMPRASTTVQNAVANMVPDSALPMGKTANGKATLLGSAAVREMLVLTANINKKTDPKRSFTKQLQTQKVAKQTSESTTPMRSQYKLTLWKQRLKKPSLPRLTSPRNYPNMSPRNNHLTYCMPLLNLNCQMGVQRSSRARSTLEPR